MLEIKTNFIRNLKYYNGPVASIGNAPDLQSGNCEFESHLCPQQI